MAVAIPEKYVVSDLRSALTKRLFPTVTVWNRLEGRPRRADFDRALKAEVRDPLWMLTKQWQIGEFFAEDAGSPVFAKVLMRTSPISKYQSAGSATEAYDPSVPLETKAEQRTIQWEWNQQKMRFDLRAQLGRQWRKWLTDAGLNYYAKYRDLYPFTSPARDAASDYVFAHRTGWQQYAALAGRSMDGGDFYLYLAADPGHKASDGIALSTPADGAKLDALGVKFQAWFVSQYYEPEADTAWKPEYLEYQFACSASQAGSEVALSADEYAQGHLDWYSFDRSAAPDGLGPVEGAPIPAEQLIVSPFIPSAVTFQGMPDPRWWALEDRKTDFGTVTPATTDLAQLLLMEFALVYANDWFLVPFRLPAGTLARAEGLAVTNNFGERFWLLPDGKGSEDNWHRWAMFQLSSDSPDGMDDTSLFVPPAVSNTLEGDALEEVEMARDEVANMVWAIERTIPSLAGPGRPGKDEARETLQYHQQLIAESPAALPDYVAAIAYLAMTTVPEHWIPFMPVHVPGSLREIQLQRSRMLRTIQGDPSPKPAKVPPRTTLMRDGLDGSDKHSYFVHEEEVPRGGITVSEAFRRTRWTKGEAYVWLGVQKQTGRGERSSGLAFDTIATAQPPASK
jgi:hypothetical protein